ncbi:uncharacterized protein LOC131624010 [Vicia villosa]|uniref:uncharacterized protein LOC131624010 n=1 Tax=Vicia villosa TaxID=3911 RepID=UPI00273B1BCB|nr:uncharacterized protein LOC131624010 [Vicia villosa]
MPNEEYISKASRLVAKRIDLLVASTREGSFVPEPRQGILVEAIETKEHNGRVCGVRDNFGLRKYFGLSRKTSGKTQTETLEKLQRKINNQQKIVSSEVRNGAENLHERIGIHKRVISDIE